MDGQLDIFSTIPTSESEDEDTKVLTSSSTNLSLDVAFGPTLGGVTLDGVNNLTIGSQAAFFCDAGDAAPRIEYTWTKNGVPILPQVGASIFLLLLLLSQNLIV